jgi:hypothetical protein
VHAKIKHVLQRTLGVRHARTFREGEEWGMAGKDGLRRRAGIPRKTLTMRDFVFIHLEVAQSQHYY